MLLHAQDKGLPIIEPTVVTWPALTDAERAQVEAFVLADAQPRLVGKRFRLRSVELTIDEDMWDLTGPCAGLPPRCVEVHIFNYTDNQGLQYLVYLGPPISIIESLILDGPTGWPLSFEEEDLAEQIAKNDPIILREIQTRGLMPGPVTLAQASTKSGSCESHRCVLLAFAQHGNLQPGDFQLLVFVDLNEERVSYYLFTGESH